MNENSPRRIGRSVAALFAGFVLVVVLSTLTDVILHATGVFPPLGQPAPDGLLLLATFYRTVYGIAGSYVTARLAPYAPMAHAVAGGALGLVLATIGAARRGAIQKSSERTGTRLRWCCWQYRRRGWVERSGSHNSAAPNKIGCRPMIQAFTKVRRWRTPGSSLCEL
jgi:hypothetical protein